MTIFFDYIFPILLGGFIGWFTNYLAIKMLFRPYKKVKIFGITIPFTPGLIPKEKARIANSLSTTIAKEFLNKKILIDYLTSDNTKRNIENTISEIFLSLKNNQKTFYEFSTRYITKEKLEADIEKLSLLLSNEIIKKFKEYELSKRISKQIIKNIIVDSESLLCKTITFLFNDKFKDNIERLVKDKIDEYMKNNAQIEIKNLIENELRNFLNESSATLYNSFLLQIDAIKKHLVTIYEMLINESIDKILSIIDFQKLINDRINELDIKELETLILNIVNKELNAITFIGGLLGILISAINVFI